MRFTSVLWAFVWVSLFAACAPKSNEQTLSTPDTTAANQPLAQPQASTHQLPQPDSLNRDTSLIRKNPGSRSRKMQLGTIANMRQKGQVAGKDTFQYVFVAQAQKTTTVTLTDEDELAVFTLLTRDGKKVATAQTEWKGTLEAGEHTVAVHLPASAAGANRKAKYVLMLKNQSENLIEKPAVQPKNR